MRMNSQIDLPAMQKIMMDFERQNDIMDEKSDLVSEASML